MEVGGLRLEVGGERWIGEGGVVGERLALSVGIGFLAHGQQQGEYGAGRCVGDVGGGEGAVMQLGQSARIVESYAGTPIDGSLGLVVELVVAFEDVFQLVFGNATTGVGDSELEELRFEV